MKTPRPPKPPLAVRHFEARRYFVESSSRPEDLLVDLDENKGRGECACEDHQFRVQPEYNAGNDEDLPCKHVRAARAFEKAQLAETAAAE